MPSQAPREPPLTRAEACEVLRYYREALKLEEALDVRPKARRVNGGAEVPRLDVPTPGQVYFKLPLDLDCAALLGQRATLTRGFDAELAQFFETWLFGQYRRGEDEGELSHLLCFPVVHLPRGELSGLLRYCVRLRFGAGSETFRVPVRAERERGLYPTPPREVRVGAVAREEGAWPFFVDTRLLRNTLGVPSEWVDALYDALRARENVSESEMLALVTRLCEHTAGDARRERDEALSEALAAPVRDDVPALLARLVTALETLLVLGRQRAKVYPVGVVVDGTAQKTTFHLQRELGTLIDEGPVPKSALGAYLTGKPLDGGRGTQRALFEAPLLTPHQVHAAEAFWGGTLSAVQGPPGTGKTTLILHLCAEHVVRKVETLLDTGAMGDGVLLVTSSNNRAVDNVMDGLGQASTFLPLGVRGGSRQVAEEVLARSLRHVRALLLPAVSEPTSPRALALTRALEDFAAQRSLIAAQLAPRQLAERMLSERARLDDALRGWEAERLADADAHHDGSYADIADEHVVPLLEALLPLERRLEALAGLCEGTPGLAQVNAIGRHYGRTAAAELVVFEQALARAGQTLTLPLPPLVTPMAPAQLMEAWEDANEHCLSELSALREVLERRKRLTLRASSREELLKARAALGDDPIQVPELTLDEREARLLFARALAVREAWAKSRASELCGAIDAALRALDEERTLRPLYRNDPESLRWLHRLFGVWGVTLLSLGNCFPAEAKSVGHVVIDEAGQCHPAHAVSALWRAQQALVIGDVHQLAPVVDLTVDDEARLVSNAKIAVERKKLDPYRVNERAQSSAQALADRAVVRRHVLVDHFRCQPEIIAVSDALCGYGLRVHTARENRTRDLAELTHPLLFSAEAGAQERLGGSLINEREAESLLAVVTRALDAGILPSEIAVITPYRGQLELLRRELVARRVPLEFSPELIESEASGRPSHGMALGTVHRFQGGERSIVLFSAVVTRESSLPFLDARENLLNVAVSRARHHFVTFGDRRVLLTGKRTRLIVEKAREI